MIKEPPVKHNKLIINRYFEEDGKLKGFIQINFIRGIPHLHYFYLHKPYRNLSTWRKLSKIFTSIVRELGFDKALIHARNDRQMKLIEYYFRTKPYAINYDDGNMLNTWYWVSVKGR